MKAHSERVPNKNFRIFCGKPLYLWVLGTLLRLDEIECVVINTDAENLLNDEDLRGNSRVILRRRAAHLCGDLVSMNRIIKEDIGAFPSDSYLMTHTTNPLISIGTIRKAIRTFNGNLDCDSLFSVTKYQTRFYREDGTAINHDPSMLIRTQDLDPCYEENSNLYLFTKKSFERNHSRIGLNPILFETSKIESIDIDDLTDWYIAEAVARFLEGNIEFGDSVGE